MHPALNYQALAAVYDDYCVFDGDLPFFRRLASAVAGPVLDLMAGTGRVSVPLAAAGRQVHALDGSLAMLARLGMKRLDIRRAPAAICADACRLPLRASYSLIILPFQGLTELRSHTERLALFRGAAELLAPGGRFVCTTHNPPVRLRSLTSDWKTVGTFARADGGSVTVAIRGEIEPCSGLVSGEQRLEIAAPDGSLTRHVLALRFSLPTLADVESLAESAGLDIVAVLGDYAGSPFDESSSQVIVTICRRRPDASSPRTTAG